MLSLNGFKVPDKGLTILVLAPMGRDSSISCQMLTRANLTCHVCATSSELFQRVSEGCGPIVIAAEALKPADAIALSKLLDAQPPWSDLPLIIFTGSDGLKPSHQLLTTRLSTTLLQRPIKVSTFITLVRAAVQSRLRQYQVRSLLESLEVRATQLQKLALELSAAEERERERLAELLHDDLQQILVGALFHAELLPKHISKKGVAQSVTDLATIIKQAIEKSRHLSHELSPPTLRQHGLIAALHWLADRMEQMHGLNVLVTAPPDSEPADTAMNTLIFRFAQELLLNVAKHSGTYKAQLTLARKENEFRFSVADNGKGFELASLIDTNKPPGFGLLSIQERARLLGGELNIQSAPGIGSTFTIVMPLRAQTSPESSSAKSSTKDIAATQPAQAPRIRVALVDDHLVMRNGLKSLLSNEDGIDVVAEASDGMEALDMAASFLPDVILIDVSMPFIDGIEATTRIKQKHPAIRVIGLSMFDDLETATRMCNAGADEYLTKTGSSEILIRAVKGAPLPHNSPCAPTQRTKLAEAQ